MLENNKYYILLTRSDKIQMFYKTVLVGYNDNTNAIRLQYLSSFDIWQFSSRNRDKNPLEGLQEITEEEFKQYMKIRKNEN